MRQAEKKEIAKWHVLINLLTQVYVSGISNADASSNILRSLIRCSCFLLTYESSVCSPVSRNCERQQHVIRVLIAWCGVDVLTRNFPAWYNKTPITQKVLYSNIYGKTTMSKKKTLYPLSGSLNMYLCSSQCCCILSWRRNSSCCWASCSTIYTQSPRLVPFQQDTQNILNTCDTADDLVNSELC